MRSTLQQHGVTTEPPIVVQCLYLQLQKECPITFGSRGQEKEGKPLYIVPALRHRTCDSTRHAIGRRVNTAQSDPSAVLFSSAFIYVKAHQIADQRAEEIWGT
jgi:hypothetical protein